MKSAFFQFISAILEIEPTEKMVGLLSSEAGEFETTFEFDTASIKGKVIEFLLFFSFSAS